MNSTAMSKLISNEELSIIFTGKDEEVFTNSPLLKFVKECFTVVQKISEVNNVDEFFLENIKKHQSEDIRDISFWLEEEGINMLRNILSKAVLFNVEVEPFVKRYHHILETSFIDAIEYNDYNSFYLSFLDAIYGIDDHVSSLEHNGDFKGDIITSTIYLSSDLQNYDLQDHFWIEIAMNSHLLLKPAKEAGFFYEERYQ
ncbi:hypothetical protein GPDM_15159 [Planococcus donghaensis MPA1U2]|uniref:Uncharacterized protein n=1 Tax=Planococcus donghaensis MPA1U2 TaxID=933115 RepID=E7RKK7_9BACL|nr:hypothetical protein [Planococcus donghaensis]EGA88437.1 hypothetical protein GPDM_15159 [Planococcus donghaensis MPA1U2]